MKILNINLTPIKTTDSYIHPFISYLWPQIENLRFGYANLDGAPIGDNFYFCIREMIDNID